MLKKPCSEKETILFHWCQPEVTNAKPSKAEVGHLTLQCPRDSDPHESQPVLAEFYGQIWVTTAGGGKHPMPWVTTAGGKKHQMPCLASVLHTFWKPLKSKRTCSSSLTWTSASYLAHGHHSLPLSPHFHWCSLKITDLNSGHHLGSAGSRESLLMWLGTKMKLWL